MAGEHVRMAAENCLIFVHEQIAIGLEVILLCCTCQQKYQSACASGRADIASGSICKHVVANGQPAEYCNP